MEVSPYTRNHGIGTDRFRSRIGEIGDHHRVLRCSGSFNEKSLQQRMSGLRQLD